MARLTTEEFIQKAQAVHGDRYDYSKVEYVNSTTKVCIICPKHGEFEILPEKHIHRHQGCPKCSEEKYGHREHYTQEKARKRILEKLSQLPYELVEPFSYIGDRDTQVVIHCKVHNSTWTTSWHQVVYAGTKLSGGCPGCRTKYSKEDCHKAALQCHYRSEFAEKFEGEYMKALREGWMDEICVHMVALGNHYKRCIYAYEFPNVNEKKYVYVGLTDHIPQRDLVHGRKGAVYTFCKKHNLKRPKPIQLTDYIDKEEAKEQEGIQLAKYVSKGWIPLNRVKTGSLGGHLANDGFTFEECKARGQRYSKRSEWKREDYPTYYIASKRGWINKILKQSERFGNAKQRYWTEKRIAETALKFESRKEFRKNEPSAYARAWKLGILDKVCGHMQRLIVPTGFTVDKIKQAIEKYDTLSDFIASNPRMCDWLTKHKIKPRDISDKPYKKREGSSKPIQQFTLDGVYVRSYNNARETIEYGFNYKNVSDVCTGKKKSHKGYVFRFVNQKSTWTYDICRAEASKYEKRSHFKAAQPGAYKKSRINGWLDEFFPDKIDMDANSD